MGDTIRCGTLAGHRRHVRRREPTCGPCRAASAAYARERRSRPPLQARDCAECRASFTPARSPSTRFCSKNCRTKFSHKAKTARRLTPRSCEWCEREFTPRHHDARLCSVACVNASRKLRTHGLSASQYRAMERRQAFRCAICGDKFTGAQRDRHVDHDHATGAVRGLLCPPCNLMLGHAKDRPDVLMAAARYIEQARVNAIEEELTPPGA